MQTVVYLILDTSEDLNSSTIVIPPMELANLAEIEQVITQVSKVPNAKGSFLNQLLSSVF